MSPARGVTIRQTRPEDFPGIIRICLAVYPESRPWREDQLASHLNVFPDGQLVAVTEDERVVGVASSLIIYWNDYDTTEGWADFTDRGMFTNHDPEQGRTLYGAEVMVDPAEQGYGIGHMLYAARREIARRCGLLRIRAGARLRGFGTYADALDADAYVRKVVRGELGDPTLSFQLKEDFHVLALVPKYLGSDPESQGYAAVIEWLNREVATPEEVAEAERRWARWES
ncbi:MAG TPA: GNAT family N-acetyltransferase [Gemmatimonadales bacterium]|nr:GNAT family N-acetyltransferase [Gemmatimonadales bacterium]